MSETVAKAARVVAAVFALLPEVGDPEALVNGCAAVAAGASRRWRRLGRLGLPRHVPAYPNPISKSTIHELVGRDDPLILEIGCNDGTDTAELLSTFPRGQIHCFECDPRPIS